VELAVRAIDDGAARAMLQHLAEFGAKVVAR
jgi:hypothetical protein